MRDTRDRIAPSNGRVSDGAVTAYAGLDHGGQVCDLMTITVTPEGRGTGIGGALLAELERRATERGAEAMMLEVRADNAPARALYDRRGYEVLRTRRGYYQPGNVDALIMRKMLGERGTQS